MVELVGLAAAITAVTGVVLNNRMNILCFYFWLVSNFLSAGLHAAAGMWSLCGRDIVFLLLAVEGLIRWTEARRGDNEDTE